MEITIAILSFCAGFIAGMYLVSQISEWINRKIK